MNPEFKRNIWQTLSIQRLVAMPAILLAIFFLVYLRYGVSEIPQSALFISLFLLVIWGSGLAADAIFLEIREHTWDAQRMTPLGPWSMAWGKLFGSTIFVWYGAAVCWVAVWWSASQASEMKSINYFSVSYISAYYLLIGVFTQAFALFVALLFQRISPLHSRARTVMIQLFAIAVGLMLFSFGRGALPELFKMHPWYSLDISFERFMLGSLTFFCASLLFGIYRLLRAELQMHSYPWAWALFLLAWIVYLWGFFSLPQAIPEEISEHWMMALYFAIAYFVALSGTFLSAFFTQKNIIQYFRWSRYLKGSRYKRALILTPPWIIPLAMAFILIFPLVYFLERLQILEYKPGLVATGFALSSFFFLLRDLGLLYYLTFDFQAKRAHLATLVYLAVLYTLLPMLLSFTHLHSYWFPAFAPWAWFTQPEPITWGQIIAVMILIEKSVMI